MDEVFGQAADARGYMAVDTGDWIPSGSRMPLPMLANWAGGQVEEGSNG